MITTMLRTACAFSVLTASLVAQTQIQTAIGAINVPSGSRNTVTAQLLGQALFWDEQLSSSGTVACGTCHQPLAGGSDPRSILRGGAWHPGADGVFGGQDDVLGSPGVPLRSGNGTYQPSAWGLAPQVTGRRSPTVINAAFLDDQFWDGRAGSQFVDPVDGTTVVFTQSASLESQAADPPVSSVEMGHLGESWTAIAQRIANEQPLALATDIPTTLQQFVQGQTYDQLFRSVYRRGIQPADIVSAIAAYERTLISDRSPFDDFSANLPNPQWGTDELRGFELFTSPRTECSDCHQLPLTTDRQFHYIGVRPIAEDRGRAAVIPSPSPNDEGAFRTPTLRNVALRAPYMHNGRFNTLFEVVDFYNRGGDHPTPFEVDIRPLGLSVQEQLQLVAFLEALTDPRLDQRVNPLLDPAVSPKPWIHLPMPFARPTLMTERLAGTEPRDVAPQRYGFATALGAPLLPRMHMIDPWHVGNGTIAFGIDRGTPGSTAHLLMDVAPAPVGGYPVLGINIHVGLTGIPPLFAPVALRGAGPGDGWGQVRFGLGSGPDVVNAIGLQWFAQWIVVDSLSPLRFSSTDAVKFRVF